MGLSVKAGSFTKNTGTGSQAVTGVGFTPKVLLLFTAYNTVDAAQTAGYGTSFGMTTGASESYSTSMSGQDNVSASNRSKRAAAKALTVVQYGETTLAEADLTSFDADGFTLDWTTNSGGAQIIHYLALGGSDITGQKVLTLTSPTSTGNKAYTGVGFKPNSLIFIRPVSASALPASAAAADFAISLVDGEGNTGSMHNRGDDAVASPNFTSNRIYKNDRSTILADSSNTVIEESTFVSVDTDGFTLNYSTVNVADIFGCLAIKGPRIKVGYTTFPSASVTGVGFAPSALFVISAQIGGANPLVGYASFRSGMGATTGSSANQATSWTDSHASESTDPEGDTDVDSIDHTSKFLVAVYSGGIFGTLSLSSFDSDGFTVSHTNLLGAGAFGRYVSYLAIGIAPTATTDAASGVGVTEATLNGTVNPGGSSASYYFEWGTTASYGNTTSSQGPTSGSSNLPITTLLTGLSGDTEYHFRCVIAGGGTTVYGSDQTFTTSAVGAVDTYANFDED